MQKETLRIQFEELLRNPSEGKLKTFEKQLRKEVQGIPICPNCTSDHIVKMGFNNRKSGPEQQFRCEECKHVYSQASIRNGQQRTRYPSCEKCGGPVKKSGFWKWTNLKGKTRKKQRFECLNSECGSFFSQDLQEETIS